MNRMGCTVFARLCVSEETLLDFVGGLRRRALAYARQWAGTLITLGLITFYVFWIGYVFGLSRGPGYKSEGPACFVGTPNGVG